MAPRKKPKKEGASMSVVAAPDDASAREASASDRAPGRRNLRGRRGGLKDMPNMPLDILIEVFTCMHPRDLLNLARTSKAFRAFLTSRNSAPFWKAAREQVEGLPDCPPFLSEPQYANLMFFPYCHHCLKPNVKTVIWEIYARYCPGCKDMLLQQRAYNATTFVQRVRVETKVHDFALTTVRMPRTKNSYRETLFVHLPEFQKLEAKWKTLTDEAEKVRFAQEHVAALNEKSSPIQALKAWKAAEMNNRTEELESIKEARFNSIVARLRLEGWADELDRMTYRALQQFKEHKAVRKPQKLSDTVWQSIRQDVIAQMEGVRAVRLAEEQYAVYVKRLKNLDLVVSLYEISLGCRTVMRELQACLLDLVKLPPFQQLIDAPSNTEIIPSDLARLQDMLPALKTAWFEEREREFLQKAREVIPLGDDGSLLSLAIVAFECRICRRADLRWPNVLAHSCARPVVHAQDPWSRAVMDVCVLKGKRRAWKGTDDMFSVSTHVEVARSVVAACGLNPDVVTYEEMEKCEARLICTACPSDPDVVSKETFDWRGAIAHRRPKGLSGTYRRCGEEGNWKLLDAALTVRVLEAERNDPTLALGPSLYGDETQCCAHCDFQSRDSVVEHCRTRHSVASPRVEEDYYTHPDSRPPERSVTLYPENLKRGASRAATAVKYGFGIYASSVFA